MFGPQPTITRAPNTTIRLAQGNFEKINHDFHFVKDDIEKEPNLYTVANVLQVAFQSLQAIDGEDLLITLGNTGCGKSTMLSSLLFGPESLEVTKQGRRTAIEQKEEFKLDTLTIGHNNAASQTFFPHFLKKEGADIMFADIAGLQDTSGNIIDIINSLINKSIFNRAARICFLVPFIHSQIEEARGKHLRNQVNLLHEIFDDDLEDAIDAFVPIITRAPPKGDYDLDVIQQTINDQLLLELETQKDTSQ